MADTDTMLNQIVTLWSVVQRAQGDEPEQGREARQRLLERYQGAVRRYLLGALRDAEVADELFQEFAYRFLSGTVAGADPSRGRFRDFVKGVLFRLVADHHRKKAREGGRFVESRSEPSAACSLLAEWEAGFTQSWRDEALARCWELLRQHEQPYYTVLRLRAEKPECKSAELATEASRALGRELTAVAVRKILERARTAYADLLVEHIAQGQEAPTRERIEEDLAELGLLEQCRQAVARWGPNN